ncbi:hypothetical protein Pint_26827 [Pistacia integerrima]|uniref:Uncharacterized protein n=1 Tax=Pistacia integerrima TaxID=434235 RepID=A0ACC0YPK6_9ROSI|nr:hypothetical protein Pint_26827 [Pistacia integerrima]
MAMKTLSGSCSSDLSSLFRGAFYTIRVETPMLLATEKKEAKSVLNLFLMQSGLNKAVPARTINKSDYFTDHLISRLRSCRFSWEDDQSKMREFEMESDGKN